MAGSLPQEQEQDADQLDPHSERWHAPMDGERVSLEEYWKLWYEDEGHYEWNNGILEAKPMPNTEEYDLYVWFVQLLDHYLKPKAGYQMVGLEIGFELNIPDPAISGSKKTVVRKPDIGIITPDNPVRMEKEDRTYHGILDICIECISDSSKRMVRRDTVIKKGEYLAGQVREYYILDPSEDVRKNATQFCHLSGGRFISISPDGNGVIHSVELPGFRFRQEHLASRPSIETLAGDPVYDFVLPNLRNQLSEKDKSLAEKDKSLAKKDKSLAEKDKSLAEKDKSIAELMAELEDLRRQTRE